MKLDQESQELINIALCSKQNSFLIKRYDNGDQVFWYNKVANGMLAWYCWCRDIQYHHRLDGPCCISNIHSGQYQYLWRARLGKQIIEANSKNEFDRLIKLKAFI